MAKSTPEAPFNRAARARQIRACHRLRSPRPGSSQDGKSSRLFHRLRHPAKHNVCLSASPARHSPVSTSAPSKWYARRACMNCTVHVIRASLANYFYPDLPRLPNLPYRIAARHRGWLEIEIAGNRKSSASPPAPEKTPQKSHEGSRNRHQGLHRLQRCGTPLSESSPSDAHARRGLHLSHYASPNPPLHRRQRRKYGGRSLAATPT